MIIAAAVYFVIKMIRKDARSFKGMAEDDPYNRDFENQRTRELLKKYPPPTARRRQPARQPPSRPAAPRPAASICPICEHPVGQRGTRCPECGVLHHSECFTLFDGCGKCGYKIA